MGGARHGEHVVEPHDRIGDHDGRSAPSSSAPAPARSALLRVVGNRSRRDPHQQAPAPEQQARILSTRRDHVIESARRSRPPCPT